jgi:putative peptidoglycan lipid II flippase
VARGFWIDLLAPGLDQSTAALTASLLSIAALGAPFYVLYSLYTLVALAQDDVRLINLRPSFQSIGLISATVAAYVTGNLALLAWGFTAPYIVLWAWGAYWVRRKNYLDHEDGTGSPPLFDRSQSRTALAMFWRRLRPLPLIPVLLQGSIAVERAVGSLLGIEVVAATEYSRFVVDSLMALIAAPLGLAGVAVFARIRADEVRAGLDRLITPVLLITVPLSIALCINSRGIITFLYARGHFDKLAVDVSSIMLLGFALGIWANVLGYTFIKVLNARGENNRVAVVNGLSFGIAAGVNLVMWRFWGPITLGVASTIGGLVMFVGSAVSLGIMRHCLRLIALLSPGIVGAVAAGWLLAGDGLLRLIASCTVISLIWLGYVMSVPSFRRVVVARFRSKVAAPGQTSPLVEEAAPVRSGVGRHRPETASSLPAR